MTRKPIEKNKPSQSIMDIDSDNAMHSQEEQEEQEESETFSLDKFSITNHKEYLESLKGLKICWNDLSLLLKIVQQAIGERNFLQPPTEHFDPADNLWNSQHFKHFTDSEEKSIFQLYTIVYLAHRISPSSHKELPYLDPEFTNWPHFFSNKTEEAIISFLPALKEHIEALIIFCNMGLVRKNIPPQCKNDDTYEEYVSLGKVVLYEIIRKFDLRKGNKFSSFASVCLQRIFTEFLQLRSGLYYPQGYKRLFNKMRDYAARNGIPFDALTRSDLLSLNISAEIYHIFLILQKNRSGFLSLDQPVGQTNERSGSDLIELLSENMPNEKDVETRVGTFSKDEIRELLEQLIELEFRVNKETLETFLKNTAILNYDTKLGLILVLRFRLFEPQLKKDQPLTLMTLREVAELFNLRVDQIKHLEKVAIKKIRLSLEKNKQAQKIINPRIR